MPTARPMMLASASGELKTRVAAEGALQAVRDLEDAALALHVLERCLAAAVGDVLAEHDDARVARHLVLQRAVDRRDHRVGLALAAAAAVLERRRRRIDVGRVDVERRGVARRLRGLDRARRPPRSLRASTSLAMSVSSASVAMPSAIEQRRELRDRIALRFGGALVRGLVQLLVVRQRVRVRADDLGVHERRALARARVRRPRRSSPCSCSRKSVPSMRWTMRPGNDVDQLRDVAAGRLHFDRHRDRVAVVFDQEDDRQL